MSARLAGFSLQTNKFAHSISLICALQRDYSVLFACPYQLIRITRLVEVSTADILLCSSEICEAQQLVQVHI